jgi:hypothetical protein
MEQSLMTIKKSTTDVILNKTESELLEERRNHYLYRIAEKSDVVGGKMHSHEDVWK